MACPGPYDAFWTFPRSSKGYSGVCTYVDSSYCVPLKAEEGITGILLDDKGSTMRPPWSQDERIGGYPETDDISWHDEEGQGPFDVKRLDIEGRAVVCDFGLFILFNLYCPNETNDSRRPYKMNFLKALQERVRLLMASGREVIIAGDLNIMRAPIDSGEGGIKTSAEQHYQHPARVIFNDWCAPRGPMVDVVRESWPEREDMFTCWNQKLDARPSNYGSRIDYILCTPGLRSWIKSGDILPKIHGSDHCPVYIDLHESITHPDLGELKLRDMLNPPNRPLSTAPIYPNDAPREAPEPPRFATKFFEEFSAKQTTLKSFFGGRNVGTKGTKAVKATKQGTSPRRGGLTGSQNVALSPSISTATTTSPSSSRPQILDSSRVVPGDNGTGLVEPLSQPVVPLGMARAAFASLDDPGPSDYAKRNRSTTSISVDLTGDDDIAVPPSTSTASEGRQSNGHIGANGAARRSNSGPVPKRTQSSIIKKDGKPPCKSKTGSGQATLASFFAQPEPRPSSRSGRSQSQSTSGDTTQPTSRQRSLTVDSNRELDLPVMPAHTRDFIAVTPPLIPDIGRASPSNSEQDDSGIDDAAVAAAIEAADAERAEQREAKKAEAAPIWSNLFAKKLPPLCTVHHKPCKDFIVKIPGPNKGKRFWLCSLPVGAGYDSGRSKRKREDVNPNFRCDFFLWDSANSRKEASK